MTTGVTWAMSDESWALLKTEANRIANALFNRRTTIPFRFLPNRERHLDEKAVSLIGTLSDRLDLYHAKHMELTQRLAALEQQDQAHYKEATDAKKECARLRQYLLSVHSLKTIDVVSRRLEERLTGAASDMKALHRLLGECIEQNQGRME